MSPQTTRRLLVVLVASAGPAILGLDLIVRHFLMSMQPEDVRELMAETITHYAWFCVPGPVIGTIAAFFAYPRLHAKFLAKSGVDHGKGAMAGADMRALFITASFVQLPALLGDFSVMLGANLGPALTMTSISTAAVFALAAFARPSTT